MAPVYEVVMDHWRSLQSGEEPVRRVHRSAPKRPPNSLAVAPDLDRLDRMIASAMNGRGVD